MSVDFEKGFQTIEETNKTLKKFYLEILSKYYMLKQNKIVVKNGTKTAKSIQEAVEDIKNEVEQGNTFNSKDNVIILMRNIFLTLTSDNDRLTAEKLRKLYGDTFDKVEEILLNKGFISEQQIEEDFITQPRNDNSITKLIKDAKLSGITLKKGKKQTNIIYGEFKKDKFESRVVYDNGRCRLIASDLYTAFHGEAERMDKLLIKSVIAYELQVIDKNNEIESIIFYGDDEICAFLSKNTDAINVLLMAFSMAKNENREYIGKINSLSKDSKDYEVQYDDNLEVQIKRIIEKEEKIKSDKEKKNRERNEK